MLKGTISRMLDYYDLRSDLTAEVMSSLLLFCVIFQGDPVNQLSFLLISMPENFSHCCVYSSRGYNMSADLHHYSFTDSVMQKW